MSIINIFYHQLPCTTHSYYDLSSDSYQIRIHLTHSPAVVHYWRNDIYRIRRSRLNCLIVGLDIEWRPTYIRVVKRPVATLQLCVGHRCLIFQIIHAPYIPGSLFRFIGNGKFTFTGVGIKDDAKKLLDDHGLEVANVIDLRVLAEKKLGTRELRNAGLKKLAFAVLVKEIEKLKRVTMSRWDNPWPTPAQVQYACVNAFCLWRLGGL
ncbi:Werner Syndrome-like exonuclease [Morella rubra]|uniref:Werner Syndrome-like exonuclease n=1 Tax=Morella rubra TaxID=262757 RepID=A0A6A1WC51_9ROSI|nr:Werner Syndrome-like exonuclease [Morella rubra]